MLPKLLIYHCLSENLILILRIIWVVHLEQKQSFPQPLWLILLSHTLNSLNQEVVEIRKILYNKMNGNLHLYSNLHNNIDIFYSLTSFSILITLTAPIQFLQQANNSPILSFGFNFQLFEAIFNNHPSGINPSKKGNNLLLRYTLLDTGIVKTIA